MSRKGALQTSRCERERRRRDVSRPEKQENGRELAVLLRQHQKAFYLK